MPRNQSYGSDGKPIVAMAGRPPKPSLSAAEWEAIGTLGNMEAAAKVSEMRGANLGSISRDVANSRRVSHDWIRMQRRKTNPTQNSGDFPVKHGTKNGFGVSHTGPRAGFDETQRTVPVGEMIPTTAIGVDNAHPGGKA